MDYGMFPCSKAFENIKPLQTDEYGEITKTWFTISTNLICQFALNQQDLQPPTWLSEQ